MEILEELGQVISGRSLHEFLEVETQYSIWFKRMCEYGFSEGNDYVAVNQKRLTAQGNENTFTDHWLKLDMAKELAILYFRTSMQNFAKATPIQTG